ncbi:MAG TPA: ROK family protein [Candidatus Saccharimonadales bacterium]|nr:ROK family protein [Candidatus Saccharimonadales bacterium]
MYVGVDIGGSKTLIAVLDDNGVIVERQKFPTPSSYDELLIEADKVIANLKHKDYRAAGIAAPGIIDRREGIGLNFGNLPWSDVPVQSDFEKILACPVVVENDANLAALSESMLLPEYEKVLYITISTGIGTGLAVNRTIDSAYADAEGGQIPLEYKGKLTIWEDFASGRAIVDRFGKKAVDLDDATAWRRLAHDWARGFIELIAIMQPDIIVIGGSVGAHFEKYGDFLKAELDKFQNPMTPIPPIQQAGRPEDAVIYGCYDLAKAKYGHN